ncbi:MAG: mannose-1-phosphate guanylyltransferase/mannose-6-phosphate isomerase [Eubacteriales bacterium]
MKNIIMCGGSGTRLWPKSRNEYPKQFCDLYMGESLFKQTVKRNSSFCDEVIVVTNKSYFNLVKKQLDELGNGNYRALLEPIGRNTAPAVTLACLLLDSDDIVLVSASDHIIDNQKGYEKCVEKGVEMAEKGYIVTFGIVPQYPETGYGYIEADGENVVSFTEKPDMEKAKEYIQKDNFYWNSGIFMFKVSAYLHELEKYAPEVLEKCKQAIQLEDDEISMEKMLEIPKISIDYAVMEHSKKIKVVPSDIGWLDLGSYEALYKKLDKDEYNNAGFMNYVQSNSNNNLVLSQDRVVCTIDVEDLIIVDTEDALFISKMGSSQKINELTEKLENASEKITSHSKIISTAWGFYSVLMHKGECEIVQMTIFSNCQTEPIIKKGAECTLLVAAGNAEIHLSGKQKIDLSANETIKIEDDSYSIENSGSGELVVISTSIV